MWLVSTDVPNSLVGQKASWEAREEVQTHEDQVAFFSPGEGHKRNIFFFFLNVKDKDNL